ncbi:MAG: hypothetical protein J1E43_08390 [Christensenellaceae bacterium]|nr:hypothetical protein [Christensenellaceae bacterium]
MTAQVGKPRILLVLAASALLMGMVTNAAFSGGLDSRESRLITAYETLRELPEFVSVTVDEDRLLLHHADGSVQFVELSGSLEVFRDGVADAWQCGGDVYFVLGGLGSDRWGYAMSADDSLCLEYLRNVELKHRGTPNVYQFQTVRAGD